MASNPWGAFEALKDIPPVMVEDPTPILQAWGKWVELTGRRYVGSDARAEEILRSNGLPENLSEGLNRIAKGEIGSEGHVQFLQDNGYTVSYRTLPSDLDYVTALEARHRGEEVGYISPSEERMLDALYYTAEKFSAECSAAKLEEYQNHKYYSHKDSNLPGNVRKAITLYVEPGEDRDPSVYVSWDRSIDFVKWINGGTDGYYLSKMDRAILMDLKEIMETRTREGYSLETLVGLLTYAEYGCGRYANGWPLKKALDVFAFPLGLADLRKGDVDTELLAEYKKFRVAAFRSQVVDVALPEECGIDIPSLRERIRAVEEYSATYIALAEHGYSWSRDALGEDDWDVSYGVMRSRRQLFTEAEETFDKGLGLLKKKVLGEEFIAWVNAAEAAGTLTRKQRKNLEHNKYPFKGKES